MVVEVGGEAEGEPVEEGDRAHPDVVAAPVTWPPVGDPPLLPLHLCRPDQKGLCRVSPERSKAVQAAALGYGLPRFLASSLSTWHC